MTLLLKQSSEDDKGVNGHLSFGMVTMRNVGMGIMGYFRRAPSLIRGECQASFKRRCS